MTSAAHLWELLPDNLRAHQSTKAAEFGSLYLSIFALSIATLTEAQTAVIHLRRVKLLCFPFHL